ncbi:MAG: redoxin domain-containing protein [Rhodoferax sp.]|uniref:redoxin family protein n=1 Tax=Rhodoferax sp. TaxID=50421 RepID=UPI00272098F5|nr:redoxin family protein [Rhodoferax sp.]MDO8450312.1 redoxin domain-containing protein [Rhodoferax sp.]
MNVDKLRRWPGRWLAQLRQNWKSHLGTLLMFLLLYAGIHAWQTRSVPSGVAPTFSAPAAGPQAGSGTIDFASWRASHPGQAVALHFWADWCPICRTEENSVSRISRDWPVLSVAMQSGDAARVQGVLTRRQLDWHTAIDVDGQIAKRFGLASVPALVVVDSHDQIRFAEVGYTSEIGMRLRLWWAQTF